MDRTSSKQLVISWLKKCFTFLGPGPKLFCFALVACRFCGFLCKNLDISILVLLSCYMLCLFSFFILSLSHFTVSQVVEKNPLVTVPGTESKSTFNNG